MMYCTHNLIKMIFVTLYTALIVPLLVAPAWAKDPKVCVDRKEISRIIIGKTNRDIPDAQGDGNVIMVTFVGSDTVHPADVDYDLNNDRGKAFFAALQTAMAMRFPVTLIDHSGTLCKDFDQVTFHRDIN